MTAEMVLPPLVVVEPSSYLADQVYSVAQSVSLQVLRSFDVAMLEG